MPKRLTGSVYSVCAFISAVTAPAGSRLASSVIDVRADLQHRAASDEHRPEVRAARCARSRTRPRATAAGGRPARSTVGSCTRSCSALPATDPHAPATARSNAADAGRRTPPAATMMRRVPHDRRHVREEEAPVAVQHAEAPRRQHEQPDAREEDPDQADRELALRAVEARRDHVDQPAACSQHAAEREERSRRARAAPPTAPATRDASSWSSSASSRA